MIQGRRLCVLNAFSALACLPVQLLINCISSYFSASISLLSHLRCLTLWTSCCHEACRTGVPGRKKTWSVYIHLYYLASLASTTLFRYIITLSFPFILKNQQSNCRQNNVTLCVVCVLSLYLLQSAVSLSHSNSSSVPIHVVMTPHPMTFSTALLPSDPSRLPFSRRGQGVCSKC